MKKELYKPIAVMLIFALMCNLMSFTVFSATKDEYLTRADIQVNVSSSYSNYSDGYATYTGTDLGANYTSSATTFKVWAPSASKVQVKLYSKGSDSEDGARVISTNDMTKDNSTGVWSASVSGDLNGTYYTYLVTVNGNTKETRDVYATAAGVNGKRSMVIDMNSTNPDGWTNDNHVLFDESTDAMVWEVSVRDFSIDLSSGVDSDKRGKFLGMVQHGTTLNSAGSYKTGIDYLIENHINCVQIMPMFDFGSVDETKDGQNWGYDPYNYNVPDGSFSSNPYDGSIRIKELKKMVKALHDAGISVIMDVVYNHTYNTTDSAFEMTVPGYYYRMNGSQFLNGSGCGNVTASDKTMFRKYMVDSLKFWANEYHIDGFRFDLMGCHDITTMNTIRSELDSIDKRIIMYGEPWTGTWPRDPNGISDSSAALMDNASKLNSRIGCFNDKFRDAIRGSNDNYGADAGYIMGTTSHDAAIKAGAMANTSSMWGNNWSQAPSQTVSYSCCHDNLTLWDKIMKVCGSNDFDGKNSNYLAMNKLAAALEFTSQGVNFTVAGEDFARTKYGDENSYNTGDTSNKINWNRVQQYNDLVQYYKGLRLIRQAYSPFTDGSMTSVNSSYYATTGTGVVAYTMQNKTPNSSKEWGMVAVITNNTTYSQTVTLQASTSLPSQWVTVVNGEKAGLTNLGTINGSIVTVPARSALVLVDKSSFDSKNITEPTTKATVPTTTTSPITTEASSTVVWNTTGISDMTDGEKVEFYKASNCHISKNIEPAFGKDIVYVKITRGGEDITSSAYDSNASKIEFDATADTSVIVIATNKITDYIYGDVDLSGEVNIKDATLIQKAIANIEPIDETARTIADVNDDGLLTIRDSTMIQKWLAKFTDTGRVGNKHYEGNDDYTIPTVTFPTSVSVTSPTAPTISTTFSTSTTYVKTNTLYLDVTGIATSGARYAAYFYSGTTNYIWVDMVQVSNNIYSVQVPDGYSNVIFCRMNGASTDNVWENRWNQSNDLTMDGNLYTLSGWGAGNLFNGTWSTSSEYSV